jgi:hypothetical protein
MSRKPCACDRARTPAGHAIVSSKRPASARRSGAGDTGDHCNSNRGWSYGAMLGLYRARAAASCSRPGGLTQRAAIAPVIAGGPLPRRAMLWFANDGIYLPSEHDAGCRAGIVRRGFLPKREDRPCPTHQIHGTFSTMPRHSAVKRFLYSPRCFRKWRRASSWYHRESRHA